METEERARTATECKAALNIAGAHYPCEIPNPPHRGLAHSNQAAQAIWACDTEVRRFGRIPDRSSSDIS